MPDKDKAVDRPSYLYNGYPYTWKDCFILKHAPNVPLKRRRPHDIADGFPIFFRGHAVAPSWLRRCNHKIDTDWIHSLKPYKFLPGITTGGWDIELKYITEYFAGDGVMDNIIKSAWRKGWCNGNMFKRVLVMLYWVLGWSWWRHQMKTSSALLALCEEKPPVTEFPLQMPVTQTFDGFFDLRLNLTKVVQAIDTPVIWDAIALIMTPLQW